MATTTLERPILGAIRTPLLRVGFAGTVEMSADRWVGIPDNPRQRDTETRATRAKHLRVLHPTHSRVNMARVSDDELYKLDGHTRAHLWAQGTPEGPATVLADVWDCPSIDDVKALYGTFDSRAAVETTADQVFGSIRESKIEFHSELLKSQRFAGAMRNASSLLQGSSYLDGCTLYDLFAYWTPELVIFDTCNPGRRRFHTGVATAALLTFRRYGHEATPFWTSFAVGGGTKMDRARDAVQALEERMEALRQRRQITGSGNIYQIVRICLAAFDGHRTDYTYQSSSAVKALQDNSFSKWLVAARKTKRRWSCTISS